MGNKIATNQIHIANATDSVVKVIVTPSEHWVTSDLFEDLSEEIFIEGFGFINVPGDIIKALKIIEFTVEKELFFKKVISVFNSHGKTVNPYEVKDVHDHPLYNPLNYFTPSGWAALCGGSDLTLTLLMIKSDGTKQLAQFNTNSDWSWIIHNDRINRSKYGTVWTDNRTNDKAWQ